MSNLAVCNDLHHLINIEVTQYYSTDIRFLPIVFTFNDIRKFVERDQNQ